MKSGASAVGNEELIAEIERLRARAERAEATLSRLRAAHEELPWYVPPKDSTNGVGGCPYHDLIDELEAFVVFIDSEGMIREVNRHAASFLGSSGEELTGRSIRNVLDEMVPDGPEHDAIIERLLADPDMPRVDEVEMMRDDGTEICVSWARRPIHDREGELLGVVAVGTDVTMQRDAERERLQYQNALRSLTAETALSEERERRAIAMRIHDEISQNLAYAKLRVGALPECSEGDVCVETLCEINDLLDNAIAGTRALAFELSPPLLHELGFSEAVEWLTEQFEDRHGIACEFTDDGSDKPLSRDTSLTLFRAIGELLKNIVRHADAENASVSLKRDDGAIEVQVSDDGRGFDAADVLEERSVRDGLGLFHIRERMDHLGGSIEIASTELTGTQVTLTAPLMRQAE